MAAKYAAKERDEIVFDTKEDAKRYLEYLAEKYFYHEVGHFMYPRLSDAGKAMWEDFVLRNEDLQSRVIEVQSDKHPNVSSMPIAEEAFADALVEIGSRGKFKNRLGEYLEGKDLIVQILRAEGLRVE
jgi:hypothetical protein